MPKLGGWRTRRMLRDKLIEHKQYIRENGDDMPDAWRRRPAGGRSLTEGDDV